MADVVKLVNRGIPPNERNQIFTQADAGTGDVVLVKDSLGKPAQHLMIEAVGAMTIRLNVYHLVFPQRGLNDGMADMQILGPNVSLGQQYKDASSTPISIAASGTFSLDNDLPVSDIEIVSAAGDFEIFVV